MSRTDEWKFDKNLADTTIESRYAVMMQSIEDGGVKMESDGGIPVNSAIWAAIEGAYMDGLMMERDGLNGDGRHSWKKHYRP